LLRVKTDETGIEYVALTAADIAPFGNLTGMAGRAAFVNGTADGLEYKALVGSLMNYSSAASRTMIPTGTQTIDACLDALD
jgi:hypothetical protein